jgi:hypothetical protein
MDIMSAASDTGMDDQLQGIVDTIPELAWSAGPDGVADFFNQRRLPSLRHSYHWNKDSVDVALV